MSKRKQFTPEQKVAMVRRHLIENVPVSDLCDEFGIHATQYYGWQKQLFENAEGAFVRRPNKANVKRQHNAQEKKNQSTEDLRDGPKTTRSIVAPIKPCNPTAGQSMTPLISPIIPHIPNKAAAPTL